MYRPSVLLAISAQGFGVTDAATMIATAIIGAAALSRASLNDRWVVILGALWIALSLASPAIPHMVMHRVTGSAAMSAAAILSIAIVGAAIIHKLDPQRKWLPILVGIVFAVLAAVLG